MRNVRDILGLILLAALFVFLVTGGEDVPSVETWDRPDKEFCR